MILLYILLSIGFIKLLITHWQLAILLNVVVLYYIQEIAYIRYSIKHSKAKTVEVATQTDHSYTMKRVGNLKDYYDGKPKMLF